MHWCKNAISSLSIDMSISVMNPIRPKEIHKANGKKKRKKKKTTGICTCNARIHYHKLCSDIYECMGWGNKGCKRHNVKSRWYNWRSSRYRSRNNNKWTQTRKGRRCSEYTGINRLFQFQFQYGMYLTRWTPTSVAGSFILESWFQPMQSSNMHPGRGK